MVYSCQKIYSLQGRSPPFVALTKLIAEVASYVPPPGPPLTFQAEWSGKVWCASEEARHDPETRQAWIGLLGRVGRASRTFAEGFISFIPWAMISKKVC